MRVVPLSNIDVESVVECNRWHKPVCCQLWIKLSRFRYQRFAAATMGAGAAAAGATTTGGAASGGAVAGAGGLSNGSLEASTPAQSEKSE